jgi:hypothetical protein
MEGLLTLLLSDKLGLQVNNEVVKDGSPEAARIRNEIRQSMLEKREGDKPAPAASETPAAPGPVLPTKN